MKTAHRTDVLLLDASVWVASKDAREPHYAAARELVVDPVHRVSALDLTLYEVANSLGVRQGRSAEALDLCRLIVGRCGRDMLPVDEQLVRMSIEIAAEHGLTAYDASYVAMARRHDWTLVSVDVADLVSKGLAVTPDAAV